MAWQAVSRVIPFTACQAGPLARFEQQPSTHRRSRGCLQFRERVHIHNPSVDNRPHPGSSERERQAATTRARRIPAAAQNPWRICSTCGRLEPRASDADTKANAAMIPPSASTKSSTSPPSRRSSLGFLSCMGLKKSSRTGRIKSAIKPATTQPIPQIYWRNNLLDNNCDIDMDRQIRTEVLAMIHRCYNKVKLRMVFDAGFCFGLLDPVSCIMVNTLIGINLPKDKIPQSDADPDPWQCLERDRIGDMDERSLRGLVAFLTCLFPYLTDSKATKYLHISEADALVAAELIRIDRGYVEMFGNAAAIETAMLCAATAGQHPNPQQFILGWKLLVTNLKENVGIISVDTDSLDSIVNLLFDRRAESDSSASALFENFNMQERVASHPIKLSHQMSFPGRDTMRRMLLTMIHGFYLQALAMLPKDELCTSLHYSMLEAGHCYGPLDPVSNIIVNTIWYHAAFSSSKHQVPKISMLSTRGLLRIAVRSFYGLVSFMCTRFKNITPDEALRCMQQTFLNPVSLSDLKLPGVLTTDEDIGIFVEAAYDAAAVAAHHPCPNVQKEFFRSSNATRVDSAAEVLKRAGHKLSEKDVLLLSDLVPDSCSIGRQEQTSATELDSWGFAALAQHKSNFWEQHTQVVRMVKSALCKYSMKPGVPNYELHVICGVNEHVKCLEDKQAINNHVHYIPEKKYIYECCHINFLATCKNSAAPPVLFFAECSNNKADEESVVCCVVSQTSHYADQVRCFYCECTGSRIVHPSTMSFHGSAVEFVKVLGRGRLFASQCSNDTIISRSSAVSHWVYGLEDDSIYCTAIPNNEEKDESSDVISSRAHLLDNF